MPRKYTDEQLHAAIQAVNSGESYKQVARVYGVSVGTLYNKVNGRHQGKVGKPLAIPESIEERLVVVIKFMAKWKLPLQVDEFLVFVKDFFDKIKMIIPMFTNNKPSRKWLYAFLKRKKLQIRFADNLKPARAAVAEDVINVSKRDLPTFGYLRMLYLSLQLTFAIARLKCCTFF